MEFSPKNLVFYWQGPKPKIRTFPRNEQYMWSFTDHIILLLWKVKILWNTELRVCILSPERKSSTLSHWLFFSTYFVPKTIVIKYKKRTTFYKPGKRKQNDCSTYKHAIRNPRNPSDSTDSTSWTIWEFEPHVRRPLAHPAPGSFPVLSFKSHSNTALKTKISEINVLLTWEFCRNRVNPLFLQERGSHYHNWWNLHLLLKFSPLKLVFFQSGR